MDLSHIIASIKAAIAAHPGVVAWLLACAAAIYRSKTPAQWIALGERLPRLQGLLKLARGAGFEPTKVMEGAEQAITGKRVPDPRELIIASQARRIEELERALAGYQHTASSTAFDPQAHITRAQMPPLDSNRGFASVRALLAVVVTVAVVVPVGVALTGCGPKVIRDPVVAAPPSAGVDGDTICHDGAPWRRSGGRWSQADRQCARLSGATTAVVCCLTQSALREDATLHACVPVAACVTP